MTSNLHAVFELDIAVACRLHNHYEEMMNFMTLEALKNLSIQLKTYKKTEELQNPSSTTSISTSISTKMFVSKLFAAFTFVSFGFVAANPIANEVAKRDNADIQTVLTTLKGQTDTILPQITDLSNSGSASDETVTPLLNQLTTALDTATASLAGLEPSSSRKRQSDDDIANLVAGIVTDITNALSGLTAQAAAIPTLGVLLAGVDTSLAQVLSGLEILLAGVLRLVANLLVDVAALLRSLAFGLTLAALGL
ncbi:sc15 protein [Moniliophthora roreri]|nr:sc15 protein [Moniliophthora roreri]